jgi:ABC-type bacteriocin/lantibiotic exporter with double-glycine peptidase domain
MKFFLNKFDEFNLPKSKIYTYQKTVAVVPRFFLELIAVLSIFTFTLFMYFSGNPQSEILVKTGVFITGAFRLLPSVSRIISSYQRLNFFKSSVDVLYHQVISLNKLKIKYSQTFASEKIKTLQLYSISFKYPQSKKYLFDKFNFEINENQIVGVLGESGSGKSTLINIISGLLNPEDGEYRINGKLVKEPIKIGYLPQNIYLMDESIKKNIAFGDDDLKIDENKIFKVLKMTNSMEFVMNLEMGIDTIVGERGSNFSGGQIKRLALSRALYFEPSILVLDEVTSGLDDDNALGIMELLEKLKSKIPIIITTHDKSQIKFCDKIFKLN